MIYTWSLELIERDPVLGYFALANFTLAGILLPASVLNRKKVTGLNSLYKPIKFALSIGILCATMGWYSADLEPGVYLDAYRWSTVGLMGFEIFYITVMGISGFRSHYNLNSPLTGALYGLMGLAAAITTLWTGYICSLFLFQDLPHLPMYYRQSIAIGGVLFMVFGLQGFAMGSRLRHTVGAEDGGKGLPFLNWSRTHGDLRVAHFFGMHALQGVPLASFFLLKDSSLTLATGAVYGLLVLWTLVRALRAKPLVGTRMSQN